MSVDPEHRALGMLLETGFGPAAGGQFAEVVTAVVDAIAHGTEDSYTNDAFHVEVSRDYTRIHGLWDDSLDETVPTDEFKAALEFYAEALSSRAKGNS